MNSQAVKKTQRFWGSGANTYGPIRHNVHQSWHLLRLRTFPLKLTPSLQAHFLNCLSLHVDSSLAGSLSLAFHIGAIYKSCFCFLGNDFLPVLFQEDNEQALSFHSCQLFSEVSSSLTTCSHLIPHQHLLSLPL